MTSPYKTFWFRWYLKVVSFVKIARSRWTATNGRMRDWLSTRGIVSFSLFGFLSFCRKRNHWAAVIFARTSHGLLTCNSPPRFSICFCISQGAWSRGATTVTATLVQISYICSISFRNLRRHVPIYTIARNSRTKVTWCARYVLLDVLQYCSIVPPKTILKLWRRTISTMTTTWRCRMTWPISFFFISGLADGSFEAIEVHRLH